MSEIQKINDDLHRILSYLENDASTGRKGLVTELHDLKKEVESIKQNHIAFLSEYRKDQSFKKGKNVVWGMIGTGVIALGYWLIKTIAAVIMKIKFGV